MDKIQLLESVLGKGHRANRDYYQFRCPFHEERHGPKLGISIGTGGWKCWACPAKGRSISGLFWKLNLSKDKIQIARDLWTEKQIYQRVEQKSQLELPKEFKPLWESTGSFFYQKAKGYVESRGVTEADIIKHRLGYCESGKYANMIIFPSYSEDGFLTFWSGRSYLTDPQYKFTIPNEVEKDQVYDENLVNWSEPVIIVESKLDAIVVRRNAVPQYGKKITSSLKNKIIAEETPKIIFCLDGDALTDAIAQSEYFIKQGIECWKVQLPIDEKETEKHGQTVWHDPSSLGHDEVWKFINRAEQITNVEIFKFRLLNKMK